jgi:hypothetical protein
MSSLEQKTEKAFNKVKAGVGKTTILKFLGGNMATNNPTQCLIPSHGENGF